MAMMYLEVAVVLALLTCCGSSSYALGSSTDDDDGPFIGVDFGTYESCMGVYKDGEVQMIRNKHGKVVTPSWVRYDEDVLVGEDAKEYSHRFAHLGTNILGVKRFLGLNSSEARLDKILLTHRIVLDDSNKTLVDLLAGEGFSEVVNSEDVAGAILGQLKKDAETYLQSKVTNVVISVPGMYGYTQRQAIIDAAKIGGFRTIKLINDPMAIVLAYGFRELTYGLRKMEGKIIMVVDFGGSTIDIGVLRVENGNLHWIGSAGSFRLGGQNFSLKLMALVHRAVEKDRNFDAFHDYHSILKVWNECEKVKIRLGKEQYANIKLQLKDESGVEHEIGFGITRAVLEFWMKEDFVMIESLILHALEKAGVDKKDVNMVLMTGGSSRIPQFKQKLKGLYKWKQVITVKKESVAYGAAVYGAILRGQLITKGVQLYDTTQWSVGVEVPQPIMKPVIDEDDVIPATKSVHLNTNEEKLTVYERFTDGQVEYTHRLGTIALPKKTTGSSNVKVTIGVDSNGVLQMEDGWKSEAPDRLLDRDYMDSLVFGRAASDDVGSYQSYEEFVAAGQKYLDILASPDLDVAIRPRAQQVADNIRKQMRIVAKARRSQGGERRDDTRNSQVS